MTKTDILTAANVSSLPAAFRRALSLVLDWECELNHTTGQIEWENVPGDSGGRTFAGLTIKHDQVPENPTSHNIADIYHQRYWLPLMGLPTPIQQVVFVEGVNIGAGTAIARLQEALNDYGGRLSVDGKLGDLTRQSAHGCPDTEGLGMAFLQKCRRHYEGIVARNPSQGKFLSGWLNRLDATKALLS